MCLIAFDWQPDVAAGPVFTLTANRDEFFRRTSAPLVVGRCTGRAGRPRSRSGTCRRIARRPFRRADELPRTVRHPRGRRPAASSCPTSSAARPSRRSTTSGGSRSMRPSTAASTCSSETGDGVAAWFCNRAPEGESAVSAPSRSRPACMRCRTRDSIRLAESGAQARGAGTLLTDNPTPSLDELIALMRDPHVADDDAPGIPIERERALSAAFIRDPNTVRAARPRCASR